MKAAHLNHIGIATHAEKLESLKKLFSFLGLGVGHQEVVKDQGVTTHFLPLPLVQGSLELLEPLDLDDAQSTVAQFLKKRGPGIHHLSFQVEKGDLDPLCHKLREAGFRLLYDACRDGAHEMRINFVHPSSAGGILVELMEPKT